MNKISLILFIGMAFSFLSCQDEDMASSELFGTWVLVEHTQEGIVYKKAKSFGDQYGLKFLNKGELVLHTNPGWCGTPPVTLAEVEGTWVREGDLLITSVDFIWTTTESRYYIEKLTNQQLILIRE